MKTFARSEGPPKVAHVSTIDWALTSLLLNQLQDIQSAGYEVTGISARTTSAHRLGPAGIRHIDVPMTRRAFTPVQDIRSLWRLYRLFRRERFTVVHTHTPKAGIYGRWAAKLAGVPVIVHTNHGFIFHEGSPWLWRQLFVALERSAASCSDLIFSSNQEDIATAIESGIAEASKFMLLGRGGIGIDVERFDPGQVSSAELVEKRREIGIAPGAPVVGCVARLVREKGWLELLGAAALVRERVPDVQFVFAGTRDPAKPDAIDPSIAAEYGVADICHFLGHRHDLPELYGLMDVFVLPSHREGLPRVLGEALSMGVPCIATDIRGCRQAIENGRTGMLVPLGDVQRLADTMVELLTDRNKARRLGEEGRRIALEQFDERLVFEKVRSEYARLLGEKRLPVPDRETGQSMQETGGRRTAEA